MTHRTLIEYMDGCQWSAEGRDFYQKLNTFAPDSEGAAIVILMASVFLARRHPVDKRGHSEELYYLTEEFGDLVFEVAIRLGGVKGRPKLTVVREQSDQSREKET